VNRPEPTASWRFEHRWGHQIGDLTEYTVTKTERGYLTIRAGSDSMSFRPEVADQIIETIKAAGEFSFEEEEK
jgi:hypothetical protein